MWRYWIVFSITCRSLVWGKVWGPMSDKADKKSAQIIVNITEDLVKDTDERMRALEEIRLANFRTASFEIGYMVFTIVNEYRMMVDKYNTSIRMGGSIYPMEVMIYLRDIENHYWNLEHLCGMIHEIERKYRIVGGFTGKPEAYSSTFTTKESDGVTRSRKPRDREERNMIMMEEYLKYGTSTKKSTRWWWPIDYGWEIEEPW